MVWIIFSSHKNFTRRERNKYAKSCAVLGACSQTEFKCGSSAADWAAAGKETANAASQSGGAQQLALTRRVRLLAGRRAAAVATAEHEQRLQQANAHMSSWSHGQRRRRHSSVAKEMQSAWNEGRRWQQTWRVADQQQQESGMQAATRLVVNG